jgi:teichuronic acid biosynthesis glycosyltransferase TuaH
MSKPRLLYVTHVDWGHIRQRPHHIASGLAAYYDVTVAAPISRKRSLQVANPDTGLRRIGLLRAPGSYRSAAALKLNNSLCAAQLRARIAGIPDIVMVTSPECHSWVAPWIGNARLAYDCMDDAQAFDQDAGVRAIKLALEKTLLARANFIFASSARLRDLCIARGAEQNKLTLIPNGWDAQTFPVRPTHELPASGPLALAYFGTIDRWLDHTALEETLRACPEVSIRLIGPNASGYVSPDARMAIEPPIPHAVLAASIATSDMMLLPFVVTDLIRAVDPVKLYEYVALGKPILSAYWPELERFRGYVTFYGDMPEFVRRIATRSVPAPPSATERAAFLAPHAWEARIRSLAVALNA